MDNVPVFLTIDQSTYRVHLPRLLEGFEKSMLQKDNRGERFDTEVREYYIKDYPYGNSTYDIHARESGADILPGRIEAWFRKNDTNADVPPELKSTMGSRANEIFKGHTLLLINGVWISQDYQYLQTVYGEK